MEKRDYIEAMIEQLGASLKKMLSKIIQDNGNELSYETLAETERDFFDTFSITIDELLALSPSDFNTKILDLKLKENHLENFSALFYQMSLTASLPLEKRQILRTKAVDLLDLANFVSNAYSIERNERKNTIINTPLSS